MVTRGLVTGIIGLGVFFASGQQALASCIAPPPPRESLANAQAAVVGVVESARPASSNPTPIIYTLRVERAFKAQLGDRFELPSGTTWPPTGNDLSLGVGERVGLFLHRDQTGAWSSSVCGQIDPDELLRAGLPLPRPAKKGGPARVLLAGPFGDVAAVSLDGSGRVRGYLPPPAGTRFRPRSIIAPCPGGRFAVAARGQSPIVLTARSLPDLRRVGRIRSPVSGHLSKLECADERGRAALLIVSAQQFGQGGLFIARDNGKAPQPLAGGVVDATLAGRTAYATVANRGLVGIHTRTASVRALIPSALDDLAVAPGGDRIVGRRDSGELVVVEGLRSRAIRMLTAPGGGSPAWADDRTLVVSGSPDGLRVLDGKLRVIRVLPSTSGFDAFAAADGRIFQVRDGRLLTGRARSGPLRSVGHAPFDGPTALLPVGAPPP